MKPNEITLYIKNYIENDHTKMAIMLTGPWGSGKSHYIQTELKPFIESPKVFGGYRCVIVSVYGTTSLNDISKRIFIETNLGEKARQAIQKAESSTCGVAAVQGAKILLNNVLASKGVDISITQEDLNNLYKTSKKERFFFIIEDLERCSIPAVSILSYVNSLTEEANAKVLLVANEDEITKGVECEDNDSIDDNNSLTAQYLAYKEKTILDTLHFDCDLKRSVEGIIESFQDDKLNDAAYKIGIDTICQLLVDLDATNLRTFIFACQKTVNILSQINHDECTPVNVFYSVLFFSSQIKTGKNRKYHGIDRMKQFILYPFCSSFLENHTLDDNEVNEYFKEMHSIEELAIKEKEIYNTLDCLKNFHFHTEEDVLKSINKIEEILKNTDKIPVDDYIDLYSSLLRIEAILNESFPEIRRMMIKNFSESEEYYSPNYLRGSVSVYDDKVKDKLLDFVEELISNREERKAPDFTLLYEPETILNFSNEVRKTLDYFQKTKSLLRNVDISKLGHSLERCSASELQEFRILIQGYYTSTAGPSSIKYDMAKLLKIKEVVSKICEASTDRIVNYRYSLINMDIDNVINRP